MVQDLTAGKQNFGKADYVAVEASSPVIFICLGSVLRAYIYSWLSAEQG